MPLWPPALQDIVGVCESCCVFLSVSLGLLCQWVYSFSFEALLPQGCLFHSHSRCENLRNGDFTWDRPSFLQYLLLRVLCQCSVCSKHWLAYTWIPVWLFEQPNATDQKKKKNGKASLIFYCVPGYSKSHFLSFQGDKETYIMWAEDAVFWSITQATEVNGFKPSLAESCHKFSKVGRKI